MKAKLGNIGKIFTKGKRVVIYGGGFYLKTQSIGKTRKKPLHSYLECGVEGLSEH